jgi:nucleoside-diphosphate-sugar epimerase
VSEKLRVLVTGPGGRIGPHLLPLFRERFTLRLLDKSPLDGPDESIVADLSDQSVLEDAMKDIDAVLHLAATSDEAPFLEELVPNNVEGVYRVFEAARISGVNRVVFASTVQTCGFNAPGTIEAADIPHPVSMYGATKLFGEALGRFYADRHGLEFVAVRIGWFQPYDSEHLKNNKGARSLWLSPNDAAEIFARCLETPGLKNEILFATSKTEVERLSRKQLKELLNYEPQDDIAAYPYTAP